MALSMRHWSSAIESGNERQNTAKTGFRKWRIDDALVARHYPNGQKASVRGAFSLARPITSRP